MGARPYWSSPTTGGLLRSPGRERREGDIYVCVENRIHFKNTLVTMKHGEATVQPANMTLKCRLLIDLKHDDILKINFHTLEGK